MMNQLLEEEFIMMQYLHQSQEQIINMPIAERKWYIDRFIQQKRKEHEDHVKATASANAKARSRR